MFARFLLLSCLLASPVLAQEHTQLDGDQTYTVRTLSPEMGLAWNIPYPAEWVECGVTDNPECCQLVSGSPSVSYVLRWRLDGVPFNGNEYEFALFYPEQNGCLRPIGWIPVTKVYDIQPGTLVIFALFGKNLTSNAESPPSNEVAVVWPWICEGSSLSDFQTCVLDCKAARGTEWCEGTLTLEVY